MTDSAGLTDTFSVVVTPAATSGVVVSGYPSPTTAGDAHTFTVTAVDRFGNTTTGYTGTVHLTSSDGQVVLPADYTFVSGDKGMHTFSATLKTAGSRSITATDTTTSSITGTQSGIQVDAANAVLFVMSGPSDAVKGDPYAFTVTAKDAYGNVATGYTGTVHFTSSDDGADLPADYTFTAGDGGVHTFSATFKRLGNQSLTVADTLDPTLASTLVDILVKNRGQGG